jgi:6-pyruvoyltetrahydropterin/6-carboxytetrahydropterin synthase
MVQDIHDIDALARTRLADELRRAITTQGQSPAQAVRAFARTLTTDDPTFASITLALNPRRSVTLRPSSMNDILLTHQYQFAASHRLYNASLSQAENEALFGKCCRESGHGHNYDVEVDVIAPIDGACTRVAMDKAVQKSVIDRFDHRNLNTDCAEFKTLLPTVEHITMVCHRLLREPIADVGGTLRQVRVWETQRTWASYPAEPMT